MIYAGGDSYLQFLWDGLHFHDVELDQRRINVCLLIMALPIIFAKLPRRRTIPNGLCPVCGYDLRATPDRCPECGTVPPKKEIISN
jgi:hypothetical protein